MFSREVSWINLQILFSPLTLSEPRGSKAIRRQVLINRHSIAYPLRSATAFYRSIEFDAHLKPNSVYNGPMKIRTILMLLAAGLALTGCENPKPIAKPTKYPVVIPSENRPWNTPHSKGQLLVSNHYRIYTTIRRPPLVEYLPGLMEASYGRYLTLTGLEDRPQAKRMPMYVMATRPE